jgi:hypothetical protein
MKKGRKVTWKKLKIQKLEDPIVYIRKDTLYIVVRNRFHVLQVYKDKINGIERHM